MLILCMVSFVAGNISQFQNSDLTSDSDGRAITVLIQYRLSVLGTPDATILLLNT